MPPPPNGSSPARRRPTGVATPAASAPNRARRPSSASRPAAAPAAGQKLICTAGPNAGTEYPLDGDEVVIGRSAENAIAIPDTSVSRKHVLLRRTGNGWAASDMGSGNGTMVNNASIAEETVLNNGDVIAMGDTELQYVDEGATAESSRPAPARRGGTGVNAAVGGSGARRPVVRSSRARNQEDPEAKAKKKKKMIQIGAVAVVLLAGFVGFKIIQAKRDASLMQQQAAQARTMDEARIAAQKGKNLIREGKWAEAKAVFESLLETNPGFGGGTIQQYLDRTKEELPNEEHLNKAAQFITKGQLGDAAKELAAVSPGTLQTERREKVRTDLDAKVDAKLREARDLMPSSSDLKKMEELLAIANDILAAKGEEQRDAQEFKELATKAIDRIKNPYVPPPAPKTPWVPVQQLFQNGDQSGALATANACASGFPRCKTLMQQIQEFADKNKKLESLGPVELLGLLDLDKKITGGPASALSKPIAIRVVAAYYQKASNAKAKGDWGQAIEYARKVLAADPGHPGAQAIVSEARGQAKDVYLRGYQMKDGDPDQAATFFKQVLQMTPNDDELHIKAKKQLDTLKQ